MSNLAEDIKYSYADYIKWGDKIRYELIDGYVYGMASPSQKHQDVLGEMFGQFRDFLKGKPCKVFVAPLDVRLNAESYDNIVVQPDIMIVCDRRKLDGKSVIGTPDMVVEVLSSNAKHDMFTKFKLYQNAGVREYWIVDPEDNMVTVHILENGRYYTTPYFDGDIAPVSVLEGCAIDLGEVFAAAD